MLRKLTAATQSQITFGRKVHWIDTAAFESSLKRKCRFSYCSSLSKNVIFLFGKKKDWWEWHQHWVGFHELALFYATADGKNFRQFLLLLSSEDQALLFPSQYKTRCDSRHAIFFKVISHPIKMDFGMLFQWALQVSKCSVLSPSCEKFSIILPKSRHHAFLY